jgi:ATP-dependent Lhr-like helicase
MDDRVSRLALKARLPRTWDAFFARHDNFTPVQIAAIPPILDGHNVIVSAPTASGKTEAAIAPLIERHCSPDRPGLALLYLTPTRALVADLLKRLSLPLDALKLPLSVKTRDQNTFRPDRPSPLLITTPESLDSLLTSHAHLLAKLRGVLLDELHLFDSTPRGDHLRVLLNRLRRIRQYAQSVGDAPDSALQCVALSATFSQPARTASRYFPDAEVIINSGGARALEAELIALPEESTDALRDYLAAFRRRGWRKALAFCNSRAEVEAYAASVRKDSPFGDAVYVHYSNIATPRRRETEQAFASAEAAICFATTTLELGIDIGDVDTVLLIGPPGSRETFAQRIGRGNRRGDTVRAACFFRNALERLIFQALIAENNEDTPDSLGWFRPSVGVQQVFSLIKQSPSGAVREQDLAITFGDLLARAELRAMLGELELRRYLQPGRPGEWKPGPKLNTLFDQQNSATCPLSLFSNIANQGGPRVEIRDQHTHATVAFAEPQWLTGSVLVLEGREVRVQWVDGEALWVTGYQGAEDSEHLRYRALRQHLAYRLARCLPLMLGLRVGDAPVLPAAPGWWLFHWLGDVYGHAFRDLLARSERVVTAPEPALGVVLPGRPAESLWSSWDADLVAEYLDENYRPIEHLLSMGPFQHLLPRALAVQSVMEQFDIPAFLQAVRALRIVIPAPDQERGLRELIRASERRR